MLFENKLIFHPIRYPEGDWSPHGLVVEDAWFQAEDGTKLHGWFVPHPAPKAVVLFTHGNGGNITHRSELMREIHRRLGVTTLLFDYRGYGRSEGSPTGEGILAGRARGAGVAREARGSSAGAPGDLRRVARAARSRSSSPPRAAPAASSCKTRSTRSRRSRLSTTRGRP